MQSSERAASDVDDVMTRTDAGARTCISDAILLGSSKSDQAPMFLIACRQRIVRERRFILHQRMNDRRLGLPGARKPSILPPE